MKLLGFNRGGRSVEVQQLVLKHSVDDTTVSTVTAETEKYKEQKEQAVATTKESGFLSCGLPECGFFGIRSVAKIDNSIISEVVKEDSVEQHDDETKTAEETEPISDETSLELAERALGLNKSLLVTRGVSIRKQLRELLNYESAVLIEARVRGMLARASYSKNLSSVVCIQRAVRNYLNTRREAAVLVQSVVRRSLVLHRLHAAVCGAVTLQAFVRAVSARKYFHQAQRSATIIQAETRGMIARSNLNDMEYEDDSGSDASDDETYELDDSRLTTQESWFGSNFSLGAGLGLGDFIDFVGDVGVGIDIVGEVDEFFQEMMDRGEKRKRRSQRKIRRAKTKRSAVVLQALIRGVLVRQRLSRERATPAYLSKQNDKFYC